MDRGLDFNKDKDRDQDTEKDKDKNKDKDANKNKKKFKDKASVKDCSFSLLNRETRSSIDSLVYLLFAV